MSVLAVVSLIFQIVMMVYWCRVLVRLLKEARAHTVAPWPVSAACVLLGAAALCWAVASLFSLHQLFDLEGATDAVTDAVMLLGLMGFLVLSLLQGGRAAYWVLLALAIPLFLLVSGMVLLLDGQWLFSSAWHGLFVVVGWALCATGLTLLVLPQSFHYFRSAYLSAMAIKSPGGTSVG